MTAKVPLYCSHSYRQTDRELNIHFWKLFHNANFSFTVDPKSSHLSTTALELMMARSAGFVAFVTYRPEVQVFECSQFMVHEFALAFLARKPRIVIRDKRVSPRFFGAAGTINIAFDRDNLDRSVGAVIEALESFHDKTSAVEADLSYRHGRVGLVMPPDKRRTIAESVVHITGDAPQDLRPVIDDPFALALGAGKCDYVIADVGDLAASSAVDYLLGRAVPLLRVCHRSDGIPLSSILGTVPLREVTSAEDLVMFWDDDEQFERELLEQVNRLKVDRKEIASEWDGQRYFSSIGREALPVFLSSTGKNSIAGDLANVMGHSNIPYFHYKFNNTIELGHRWVDALNDHIAASKVFVMLIDGGYWNSEWCKSEYEYALNLASVGRLVIIPVFLEGSSPDVIVPFQGKDLRGMSQDQQVQAIVHELDEVFVTGISTWLASPPYGEVAKIAAATVLAPLSPGGDPVDIAIVTILEEEYDAVLRCLSGIRQIAGSVAFPNIHSWIVGEVYSPLYSAAFRIVLALSSNPGTSASTLVVKNTILAFEPHYVLVVGIAGGLGGTRLGDVVVANRICAYEYGKIDHGFHPRDSFDCPTDGSIYGAARTLDSRFPSWHENFRFLKSKPKVHVGHVASGDKVVDDPMYDFFKAVTDSRPSVIAVEMEGAGAGAAIQDTRELHRTVGFGMIRGISDVPPPGGSVLGERAEQSAQSESRDSMKVRASNAAAACAAQLIASAWPRPPR
ncbi:TIR domain-containing protein [Nocardia salmonicida]|uniref:TIR domain-containing protein n=1 Tax=Nocardia salmonicida TaxID=53431 RepID=UPI00366BA85E